MNVAPEQAAQTNDFEALFHAYYSRLARLLYRVTGDFGHAEEVAAEAFWRLHRKSPPAETNFEGWLYRTGVHLALDHVKKEKRRARYEALAAFFGLATTPEEALEKNEESSCLERTTCTRLFMSIAAYWYVNSRVRTGNVVRPKRQSAPQAHRKSRAR